MNTSGQGGIRRARQRNPHTVWELAGALDAEQSRAAQLLAAGSACSPTIARILVRRGYTTPREVEDFRQRRMDLLLDPGRLPDMPRAVARIAEAVEKKQHILLFGDYDVDGVTATALLARFLELLRQRKPGFKVTAWVPERRHGYGLSSEAVRQIRELKPDLLIALDNGSTAHAAIEALNADGIGTVVVDHHTLDATLPPAHAVVNPRRCDVENRYPFQDLCGAGLSFKLAWALAVHYSHDRRVSPEFRQFLLNAMALAAMGTIADVVPLKGENRVLAWHGLQALARSPSPGLRALLQAAQVEGVPTAGDVSFRLAPRLNAAGRCASAREALELLLCEDALRATELAARLNELNAERQALEERMLEEARAQALAQMAGDPRLRGLVLHSENWHQGVVGIVASRMVEEFNRPALLLALNAESGVAQGSGRSIRGLNLHTAMAKHRELFKTFGGHAAAAGVSLPAGQLAAFQAAFEGTLARMLSPEDLLPRLYIEESVALEQLDPRLCAELDGFEPCGAGNPRPVFAITAAAMPAPPRLMGKTERHVQFFIKQGGAARRVVGFNLAEHFNALSDLAKSGSIDIAGKLQLNQYQGQSSVEIILESFRAGGK